MSHITRLVQIYRRKDVTFDLEEQFMPFDFNDGIICILDAYNSFPLPHE